MTYETDTSNIETTSNPTSPEDILNWYKLELHNVIMQLSSTQRSIMDGKITPASVVAEKERLSVKKEQIQCDIDDLEISLGIRKATKPSILGRFATYLGASSK